MFLRCFRVNLNLLKNGRDLRLFSTEISSTPQVSPINDQTAENSPEASRSDKEVTNANLAKKDSTKPFHELAEYRFVYPEFLPNPRYVLRNKTKEKLERTDMLKRRTVINIPEFYTGSILAITSTDPYAPGKENRFVGICVARTHDGMRATFTLRNVVDQQGVEIMYDLYNPTILKFEVLRLEKRLDDELYYLRDALPEYSTFPFDLEQEYRVEGEPVPINPLKVQMKPHPWTSRWELKYFKGLQPYELPEWNAKMLKKNEQPWEAYDLMKEYRRCIPEDEQQELWQEVEAHQQQFQLKKKKWKQRTLLKAPKKT